MPENNEGESGGFLERVAHLETAIANERVLLAKAKFKRKCLADQITYQRMLMAVERDISGQLTKLQKELHQLTRKDAWWYAISR